jgi:hypothetical protein
MQHAAHITAACTVPSRVSKVGLLLLRLAQLATAIGRTWDVGTCAYVRTSRIRARCVACQRVTFACQPADEDRPRPATQPVLVEGWAMRPTLPGQMPYAMQYLDRIFSGFACAVRRLFPRLVAILLLPTQRNTSVDPCACACMYSVLVHLFPHACVFCRPCSQSGGTQFRLYVHCTLFTRDAAAQA